MYLYSVSTSHATMHNYEVEFLLLYLSKVPSLYTYIA